VRVGVLGALQVWRGDEALVLGSPKQRRLLAVLAVHAGEVVSIDRLADMVWSGDPPPSVVETLRNYVARLRASLGSDAILTRAPGYVLGPTVVVDDVEFAADPVAGLPLWRGRPYAEFADEEWARPSVVRLEELYASAREHQVEGLLAASRVDEAVAAAEELCASAPLRERAHGLLMRGLAKQGRVAEALRVFDAFRTFLADETGLSPSQSLAEVERAVLKMDAYRTSGASDDFPASLASDVPPGNLPNPRTSFVGREREVGEVAALIGDERLVTLTGVGGVGKTRLAMQVATTVSSRFQHGAWLVELAGVRDPNLVTDAIRATLGISSRPDVGLVQALTGFVQSRELLLVLDNCEHLLGAISTLVRTLQAACPTLVVLATSREGLGVAGERLISVAPLELPSSTDRIDVLQSDAVRLFVDRAIAVKADFTVTDANANSVVEVVRRLEGIPLALELAAARVQVLSPAQIAQRLHRRFRLLSGGERGAIERHATLRAAIDWSYELLSSDEQRLLARLSVFAQGCSLEAVEAVCSATDGDAFDTLDLLSALVARSLVKVDDTDWGERRYQLLEMIRQYAEEQLDPAERISISDQHAAFYLEFVEAAAKGARGPEELRWLPQTDSELENIRSAMTWAIARGDDVTAQRYLWAGVEAERGTLAAALLREAEAVLALPGSDSLARNPHVLVAGALAAAHRGDWQRAEVLCSRALNGVHESNDEVIGWAAVVRAGVALATDNPQRAIAFHALALRCFRRFASPYHLVRILMVLATTRAASGDVGPAIEEAEEAVTIARRVGNLGLISAAIAALAHVLADSQPQRSRLLIAESIELAHIRGAIDEHALVMTLVTCTTLGEHEQVLLMSAPAIDRGFTATVRFAICLEAVASALAASAPEAAATLQGQVDKLLPNFVSAPRSRSEICRQRASAVIETCLGMSRITDLRAVGACMSQDEATAFALHAITKANTTRH
jgi:pentatricopeptide repeat protein